MNIDQFVTELDRSFAASPFVKQEASVPPAVLRATLMSFFEVDAAGAIVAKDAEGNRLMSPSRPGMPADFEEAVRILAHRSPQSASLLKRGNSVPRALWDRMDPVARMAHVRGGGKVHD
ncbi:DUF6651 domain-containing protein [Roseomonas sp. CCTCC AB2023176]|uniref:DUF6651 domain-containing protein n=1 Tax=Roseomonas sp. CCTCC AB2023176 TaxID=3342640 RepID=UPI0035D7C96D